MIEPDRIRVDLLKLKRKLYLSYPFDSRERKDFLMKNKLSEISFLTKLVPEETANLVLEEYKKALQNEIINIFMLLCLGGCFTVMMLGFHQLHPALKWLGCWYVPLIIAMTAAATHVKHIIDQWNGIKPFKVEYAKIQDQIKKLKKDTKNLE